MNATSPSSSVLPATWGQVLDGVQAALVQAQAEAAAREESPAPPPDAAHRSAPWHECLTRIADRLDVARRGMERTAQAVAAIDAALEESEGVLRAWRERARASG